MTTAGRIEGSWSRPIAVGAVVAVCLAALAGGSQASPTSTPFGAAEGGDTATVTSSEGVEVSTYGSTSVYQYQNAENPRMVLGLHGVQRVEGATVVYFSLGYTGADELRPGGTSEQAATQIGAAFNAGGSVGSVRLVDTVGQQVYATVLNPDSVENRPTVEPFGSRNGTIPDRPDELGVMYAVLPELPASDEQVDVDLLFGVTIPGGPVNEGYLEPALPEDEVIELGTGWPAIDTSLVADIEDPESFIYPLAAVTEALDDSETVTDQGQTVTIDVAADVLFAFDRADLTAPAQAKIAEVAQRLVADGATGRVSIVGHTDSQGSDSYNQDLSDRRAQAVAAVLQPALAGQDLQFAVEGRGESEPVAENSSPQGQQANRRVSITYTQGG